MIDVANSLKMAAEKAGFNRVRYKEKNIPTSIENVVVLSFFGDRRSSFVLSSLILRRIKEELKGSKYFVLVSWPGDEGIYPYVDEYWEPNDNSMIDNLKNGADGFLNSSHVFSLVARHLNQYFYDVLTDSDLIKYYHNGITKEFFDRFKHIKVSLPSIPSVASLGSDFARTLSQKESKVFVYPSKEIYSWKMGKAVPLRVPKQFWTEVLSYLLNSKFFPIVHNDAFSYDMSVEFTESCLHLKDMNLLKSMGVMRSCGCVLDFFNGISRYAIGARTPFVCFDERARFNGLKEYEINDICGIGIPKEYIFGFATIIEGGDRSSWKSNLLDHMIIKLNSIYEKMDRDSWPSTIESNEIIAYDAVRKIKNKRLGSRFIKIERD